MQGSVYNIAGNARVQLGNNYHPSQREFDIKQIFQSHLVSERVFDRAQQISSAVPKTYQWMLRPLQHMNLTWDCFASWFHDASPRHKLYWIHGKPGSGKSTMMKFLYRSLPRNGYGSAQTRTPTMYLHHYFWSSGNQIQRSIAGLYRSLIYQIIQECPDSTLSIMQALHYMGVYDENIFSNCQLLQEVLLNLMEMVLRSSRILIFVDGIDECNDIDDQQELVCDFLKDICEKQCVKVVVSSRPDNLFKDTFDGFPRLRLEDLTKSDIEAYVSARLDNHPRWKTLVRSFPHESRRLEAGIVHKSNGVFLWVVLVVRDIIKDLRHGSDIHQLQAKVSEIPADLDSFFMRIIQSIEPQFRCEASILLQLALNTAQKDSLRLIDSFFLSSEFFQPHFGIAKYSTAFMAEDSLIFYSQVEAAVRKLSSRCKGLLECNVQVQPPRSLEGLKFSQGPCKNFLCNNRQPNELEIWEYLRWLLPILRAPIDFLHRSLRDYMLQEETQAILKSYADVRPMDILKFFKYTTCAHLESLRKIGDADLTDSTASFLASMLETNPAHDDSSMLEHLVPDANADLFEYDNAYFSRISGFERLCCKDYTFLCIAINNDLVPYALSNITRDTIRRKRDRPILDHILRPSFPDFRTPAEPLVSAALANGADPNERYGEEGYSVWLRFLVCLKDHGFELDGRPQEQQNTKRVLSILIRAGAMVKLRYSELPDSLMHRMSSLDRSKWHKQPDQNYCYVSVILEEFEADFEMDLKDLVEEVKAIEEKQD